jgi:hypothetical protein
MSDGQKILKITGYTPDDFTLTGTMRQRDKGGDPLSKFDALEAMAQSHLPVIYTWTGDGASKSFPVIVRGVRGNIVEHNNFAYTIILFRQGFSRLVPSGYAAVRSRNQRLSQHQTGLNTVRNGTGANTQAAIDASNAAAAARRHGGN